MNSVILPEIQMLKYVLEVPGWTQERIAKECETTFATVNRWLNQGRKPHPAHAKNIERLFLKVVPFLSVIEDYKRKFPDPLHVIRNNPKVYKELIIQLTYYSNAIEGSTVTREETEKILYEKVFLDNRTQKEQQETVNHKQAVEYVLKNAHKGFRVTEEYIRELHNMIVFAIDENRGEFRKEPVYLRNNIKTFPNSKGVPKLISNLVAGIEDREKNIISRATLTHYEFEDIHPFTDGNGRVGRLLMITQLLAEGYAPAIIRIEDRVRYMDAFRLADLRDYSPLILFIGESIIRGYSLLNSAGET